MGVCVRSLHAAVLGIAATIYLVLGLAFIAASAATFFTAYGQIFTPIYAGSGMAAGVVIFDHSAAMTLYWSEGKHAARTCIRLVTCIYYIDVHIEGT